MKGDDRFFSLEIWEGFGRKEEEGKAREEEEESYGKEEERKGMKD